MLNKKRLAALGLSAVMVASTASLPVSAADFSDGSDVVAAQSDVVTDESEDFWVTENDAAQDSVKENEAIDRGSDDWNIADEKVYFTVSGLKKEYKIKVEPIREASCDKDGEYLCTVLEDIQFSGLDTTKKVTITKEQMQAKHEEYHTTKVDEHDGNCLTGERAYKMIYNYCTECVATYGLPMKVELEKPKHVIKDDASKVVTYKAGDNTWQPSGKETEVPKLIDPSKKGSYTIVTTGTCAVCELPNVSREDTKEIAAEGDRTIKSVTVSDLVNINTEKFTFEEDYTDKDLPKNEDIVLKNCDKDGSYVVTINYDNGTTDGGKKVVVPAHHVYENETDDSLVALSDAGIVNESLRKFLTPVYNDEKTKIVNVINSNCAKDIKYRITSVCKSNEKHVSEREGVATKSTTNHSLDVTTAYQKSEVEKAVAGNPLQKEDGNTESLVGVDLIELSKNANVKIIPETATCEKSGTVTVEFYCQLCGAKAATVNKVKTAKLDHYITDYSKENVVAATCEKTGSYEQVEKCKICGDEIRRETVITKALGHTNAKGDVKGAEAYVKLFGDRLIPKTADDYFKVGQVITGQNMLGDNAAGLNGQIIAKVYTNCATCHDNEQEVKLIENANLKNLKVVVTSIKNAVYRETSEGGKLVQKMVTPGTIDLKVTYTRATGETVTKETSFLYGNKKGVAFPDEYKSGLEKDADGVYRYYKDGQFDATYVGFAELDGEQFFVNKGLIEKSTGLKLHEGKWYNLAEGRLTAEYTGAILYDGSWFYVTNGVMNTSKSGLADYNGGTFLFTDGRLRNDVNGLWLDPTTGIWYFLSNGQVQTQHTGVAMYDGAFFYIQGGQLAKNYKGTVKYDGHTFNVVEGQLYGPIK